MITRQTSLSANIISFCRYLRLNDFSIGFQEQRDALLVLGAYNNFTSNSLFKQCLSSIFCSSKADINNFSELFDTYWKELEAAVNSKKLDDAAKPGQDRLSQQQASTITELKQWLYNEKTSEEYELARYSPHIAKGLKGAMYTDHAELKQMIDELNVLVARIANKRTRRYTTTHKKDVLDLRKTMRKNIISKSELLDLVQKTKRKELKVVLLCDISRSMDLYSRFFIQFMYAFRRLMTKSEVFVFSTSLSRITEEINENTLDKSLKKIFDKVNHWSGGTRIGESLSEFVTDYNLRLLNSKTVVYILSDGWDTGDEGLISHSMYSIAKRSMKVVWLNPLMKDMNSQPEVRGLKEAMPYIDLLLPFYNLETMQNVIRMSLR